MVPPPDPRCAHRQQPGCVRASSRLVKRPLFSVPVRDLERADQRRTWEIPSDWINSALDESDARSDGTPGTLEMYLKKQGREVLVKGQARANVTMPCARTLEPVSVSLDAEILLLLTPRPSAPAGAKAVPGGVKSGRRQRRAAVDRPLGARRDQPADEAPGDLLSQEEAGRDEYDGENVDLDAFVREHLLLELPLFPVRSDLPFEPNAATDTPPDESGAAPDPRLAPLAALASELQRTGKLPRSS